MNNEDPVGNPVNDFSQFKNDWIEVRLNRGIVHVNKLESSIRKLKNGGKFMSPDKKHFFDDMKNDLEEILNFIKSNNEILKKELARIDRDEELRKIKYEDQ